MSAVHSKQNKSTEMKLIKIFKENILSKYEEKKKWQTPAPTKKQNKFVERVENICYLKSQSLLNKRLAVFHRSNGKTWIFYWNRGYTLNKAGGICVRNLSKKIFEERDFKTLQYVFDSSGVCISQRCIHSLGFRHMFAELEGKLFKDYKRHKIKWNSLLIEEHLSISLPSAAKISGWKIQIRETKQKTRN